MASQITPKTTAIDRDTVLALFDVPDRDAVLRYLDDHEALLPVLAEARREIPKYFPDSRLELSVFVEPEGMEYRQLFIYIYTAMPVEEAMKRLDNFDENWYLDADLHNGHAFNVDLRFE